MNNVTTESPSARTQGSNTSEELNTLKRELMRAEVRLAKARATVVGAEIDIKVLNTRLKALTR